MKKHLLVILFILTNVIAAIASGHVVSIVSQTNVGCTWEATGSATVTVTGGTGPFTYSWAPGGQTTATVTGLTVGCYTVVATDQNDLSTAQTSVCITQPVASLSSSTLSITNVGCKGAATGSATVTGNGGTPPYTYTWAPYGGTASNANGLSARMYTVTITDNNGCSKNELVPIAEPATALTISVSNTDVSSCGANDGIATVSASGGTPSYSYLWDNGQTNATITGLPGGSYTITVTDNYGCSNSSLASVGDPTPIANITGVDTICSGSSTTLTGGGSSGIPPYTYAWSSGLGNGPTITVSPGTTTTYTLTVTDGSGCSANATKQITVQNSIIPSITGNNTVCSGQATTLSTSGGGTYSWNTGSNSSSITVSPTTTTTYSVTVTNGVCSGTGSIQVTVNPNPTPSIIGTTVICSGSSVTLTASGGSTYSWSTGETTTSITVSPMSNANYTVTASSNGCTGQASVAVAVAPVSVSSANANICQGESTILTASSNGPATFTWAPSSSLSSSSGSSVTASPTVTTNYTITASTGSCSGSTIVTVTVNPPSITSVANGAICQGGSTNLIASGAMTYTWSPATGLSSTTGSTVTANPSATTLYTITGASSMGCTSSTTAKVTVSSSPAPVAEICMVTTDSASKYNIIIWNKTALSDGDNIIVYREITSGNYQPIGTVPFDSLSQFIDTVRTQYVPNTGDPNTGSYRYKIRTRNVCGDGQLSPYHSTIHITNSNGTFSWPQLYTIENGANPVVSYNLMRDNLSNGNWQLVATATPTQQSVTDPQYTTYQSTASWRVETQFSFTCTPTRSTSVSLSNIYPYNGSTVNIQETATTSFIKVYPNPFSDQTTFIIQSHQAGEIYSFELLDVLGKQVQSIKQITTKEFQISRNGLPDGIYFYKIYSSESPAATGKLIIK